LLPHLISEHFSSDSLKADKIVKQQKKNCRRKNDRRTPPLTPVNSWDNSE